MKRGFLTTILILAVLLIPSISTSQPAPYRVEIRFGEVDTTCVPSCAHPTEWSLPITAEIYDSANALVIPSAAYFYDWGVDFCRGGGIQFGWSTGWGNYRIQPDGNRHKSEEGCCSDCLYQTYFIAVKVQIDDTTIQSRIVRLPDGGATWGTGIFAAYPNPCDLSTATKLVLTIPDASKKSTVYIYSISFDLLFEGSYPVVESYGKRIVEVQTRLLRGRVPTGVSLVVVKTDLTEFRRKVVFFAR